MRGVTAKNKYSGVEIRTHAESLRKERSTSFITAKFEVGLHEFG